jgi:hypothetical protein
VTNGIKFQGLNMDVGHLRSIRWVKDDNPASAINAKPELTQNGKTAAQNRWIAYNKSKGQYSSAMEHAVPEDFWVDKTKCKYTDADGKIQNPTLQACAEGISAVKAIAIAQSQGQKIYTINKENRDTALPKLTIGGAVGDEIRNAINAGKEVTFHESAISAHGWSGYGYIILDPETGVGAHLIDGGGSGGVAYEMGLAVGAMILATLTASQFPLTASAAMIAATWIVLPYIVFCLAFLGTWSVIYGNGENLAGCFTKGALDVLLLGSWPRSKIVPDIMKTIIWIIKASEVFGVANITKCEK